MINFIEWSFKFVSYSFTCNCYTTLPIKFNLKLFQRTPYCWGSVFWKLQFHGCSVANLSALADLEEERAMLDNMKETDILSDLDSNDDQPSAYNQDGS